MKSEILNKDFKFEIRHIGLMLSDDLWVHDKWIVIINDEVFEYFTGIGHRESLSKFNPYKDNFNKVMDKTPLRTKENLLCYIDNIVKVSKVKKLNIDDVLHCLLSDADALNYTFEDWADCYGYDLDSIKAMEVYKACQNNGKKLKKFINNIEQAMEKFQDY